MTLRSGLKTRLKKVEKALKAGQPEKWLTVVETRNDPTLFGDASEGIFRDVYDKVYTQKELEELDASGVNIIKITWTQSLLLGDQEDHDSQEQN